MKIKYLKIRNIASIESGDIDFENGLTDLETGLPSSVFLITGDTGSGKSVILDCISMALYGTTPRVRGVNGLQNNFFKNGDGQEISVSSINQYTRIGISSKDESYSELVFVGNDGIEYTSHFALGKTNRNNLRKPEWTLISAGSELVGTRKKDIQEIIQNAVGLTFEQFSRMAMLAQGQFATFLTGAKEEREVILEQLTDTKIFTRYGNAIAEIHRRAKQERELGKKLFEEFEKKILSEETLVDILKQREEKTLQSSALQTELNNLRTRITQTESALKAEKTIVALKAEEASLKAYEDSSDFRRRQTILALWDNTEKQRKLLSDKLDAAERLVSDSQLLKKLKTHYTALSENLKIRCEVAEARSRILKEEKDWIKSKEDLRPLFSDSSVTIHRIGTYLNLLKESERKKKESEEGKVLADSILKDVAALEKDVRMRSEECEECLKEINRKSHERDSLNPAQLRLHSERFIGRRHSLMDLSEKLASSEREKVDVAKVSEEVLASVQSLSQLKETAEKKMAACVLAEKNLKAAESRYMTMHLSVDRNFRELRKKLSDEHASKCPLCGQSIADHIGHWSDDAYFSDILSPLEEEKKNLAAVFADAKKESDSAEKTMNTTIGALKTKEEELENKKRKLANMSSDIQRAIKDLGLKEKGNISESIAGELFEIEKESSRISEKLTLAEKLQKDIDELIKHKETLDKQFKDADTLRQKTITKLTERKEAVRNADRRIEELKLETNRLKEEISSGLKGYADDWQSDPLAVSSALRKEAEEYSNRNSLFAVHEQEHASLLKALKSLVEVRTSLTADLVHVDEGEDAYTGEALDSMDIEAVQKKWNELLLDVSNAAGRLRENELKIKQVDVALQKFEAETGTSEATLRQLLGAADEIRAARSAQLKHKEDVSRVTALLSDAGKSLNENLLVLKVNAISELKDPMQMKTILADKERLYDELRQHLGVIQQRLEADETARKDSETQRAELQRISDRYEKWEKMNRYFGGTRFRTLVQSHILRPLLDNANIYLRQITDHYTLTCSDDNEQLSILVLDRYHNNEPRSVTVLSGGERFMISLALSLALSAMNRPDLNVDILFIDEGFGTLDARSLEMVMSTLRRIPEINGQNGRRVGVISHREELSEQIPTQIQLRKIGDGRSKIVISK